ncbi:MAG: hypothetical protein JWP35_3966 [Caulobacter sp.]|nr:hypothetical protein [Caulobacter sp.]
MTQGPARKTIIRTRALFGVALFAAALGAAAGARAQSAPVRAEVPVREADLSNGVRRYAVSIIIGSTTVRSGLDTGSTGLRVLPGVLKAQDAQASGRTDVYTYGSGARFDGVTASGVVTVGALGGPTSLQLIQTVGCKQKMPGCAAGRVALEQYGIQGEGLPGQGFKAILGVNMGVTDMASPFAAIGARQWLVDLPRPGEIEPGRIVLNPSAEETAGFVMLPLAPGADQRSGSGLHDALPGCLENEATKARICGLVLFDTGAPGIRVVGHDVPDKPWADETPVTLLLSDAHGTVKAGERLIVGRRAQASRLTFERRGDVEIPRIFMGVAPYFAFSVLYDPGRQAIGLKARSPATGGPVGVIRP